MTATMTDPYERKLARDREYVEAGAKMLDRQVPDWRQRIDVETLDLGSSRNCVLGQLYGDYGLGLTVLGSKMNHEELTSFDGGISTVAWKRFLAAH